MELGANHACAWDVQVSACRVPLYEECPKYYGHKLDPGVKPGTCDAVGERAQVLLMWVRALGVENTSHSWRLRVMRVRP